MCWLGCIPPRREEGPALGVSTPQVCIRVVPGKRELLLLLLLLLLLCVCVCVQNSTEHPYIEMQGERVGMNPFAIECEP